MVRTDTDRTLSNYGSLRHKRKFYSGNSIRFRDSKLINGSLIENRRDKNETESENSQGLQRKRIKVDRLKMIRYAEGKVT